MNIAELLDLDRHQLMQLLRGGHPIDPEALDDTEYRGVSLGIPSIVERVTWKTFKKVFHRDTQTGALRGWNVRMKQRGLAGPWEPMMQGGAPRTFGHFEVVSAEPARVPAGCARGLLIDYGRGRNHRYDPVGRLRDPIVALEATNADLLLGWSYLQIGGRQVGTPSFFCLSRDVPLSHVAVPPAA